jgi:class 3 adenylate cyclase
VTRLIRAGDAGTIRPEARELTVMFTDIAGFTAMSETRPAPEVADFLNEHFALLGACVEAEGGTVDKFIGDALMAFWGAPETQTDTAPRACRAALAIARAVDADNARRTAAGRPAIRIRIGLHSGPVVVGNVGWPGRINYTIVGDTVNTCQRLEARAIG